MSYLFVGEYFENFTPKKLLQSAIIIISILVGIKLLFSEFPLIKFTVLTLLLTIFSIRFTFIRPLVLRILISFIFVSLSYIVWTRIFLTKAKRVWNSTYPLNSLYKFKVIGDQMELSSCTLLVSDPKYNGIGFNNAVPVRSNVKSTAFTEGGGINLSKLFTWGQNVSITYDNGDGRKTLHEGPLKGVRQTKLLFKDSPINPNLKTGDKYKNVIIKSFHKYKLSSNWKD